jgi:hypothetical protein
MNTTKIFSQEPQPELSFDQILHFTVSKTPGNIIEIGCGNGDTSLVLLKVCKKYNVKFVAIDPFEDNWDNVPEGYGTPYPYKTWSDNVKQYKDIIVHHRLPSQDKKLYKLLEPNKSYSFAFVDGIQYKDAVLSDINLMVHLDVPVICLDDFTRNTDISQVPTAVDEFLSTNKDYKLICDFIPAQRVKAYLVKNSW